MSTANHNFEFGKWYVLEPTAIKNTELKSMKKIIQKIINHIHGRLTARRILREARERRKKEWKSGFYHGTLS